MQNIFLIIFTALYHQRLIPLKGNILLNYYYTEAYIGSNKQKVSLIVDTGSHMIVFPCEPCRQCGKHENKNFNYESSTTFEKVKPYKNYFDWSCNDNRTKNECYFYQGFMEQSSYEGFYAKDNFLFENELDSQQNQQQQTAIFGCAQTESGFLSNQKANGIIGIGPRSYKSTLFPPSITQIEFQEKRIDNLSFSLCISEEGGFLKLGDTISQTHLENSQTINGDIIDVDWQQRRNNGSEAIIDTGTTFVYLHEELYFKVKKYINDYCSQDEKNCYGFQFYQECYNLQPQSNLQDFYDSFPNMIFTFKNNQKVFFYPDSYIFQASKKGQPLKMCMGLRYDSYEVFGAIFFQNYDLHVNLKSQQIQITRADCSMQKRKLKNINSQLIEEVQSNKSKQTKQRSKKSIIGLLFIIVLLIFTIIYMFMEYKKRPQYHMV